MTALLLLLIGLGSPWVVHVAPPRQRPLALVLIVALFLLFGIFVTNPLTTWQMWAGLIAGVLSILVVSAMGGGGSPGRHRHRASRGRRRDHEDVTGEI